jgi:hypothetical protein
VRDRKTLPQLATFAGGVIAAPSATTASPPPRAPYDGHRRAGVTIASCDVVLRLPDPVARRWRAGVVASDLQPADVLALLLRRQHENPADLSDPPPAGPRAVMTVTLPNETLADLDRLREATGVADRSALCAALLAGQPDDL